MHLSFLGGFRSVAVIAACSFVLHAELSKGWELSGIARGDYDCGIDSSATYHGQPSTRLKSREGASPDGFAAFQVGDSLELHPYRGKRVRFSAYVKAENVSGWAGLWMRVDGARDPKNRHSSTLAYDNMQNRPITGTCGWQRYSVVLDVPARVRGIYVGITLTGAGAVWLNDVKVEAVGKNIQPTGVH